MSEVEYYTAEGLKKLRGELEILEHVERPRVTKEIADARDKGDLSENAEYHAAKEEQSHLEYTQIQLKWATIYLMFMALILVMSSLEVMMPIWLEICLQ